MGDPEIPSFVRFNYLLRPSKQVERKLFIEALHRLSIGGFDIRDYTYLGFGSVYYADFVLFHRYLYVDSMICVEAEDIPMRMEFNKPFDFITLRMKRVSDVLPELDREKKHIVWLDYDYQLGESVLQDVEGCLQVLAPESIVIVTVDAEPRLDGANEDGVTDEQRRDVTLARFRAELGRYVPGEIKRNVMSKGGLPKFFASVLRTKLKESAEQKGRTFYHLFNYQYADGAQMLSVGGMIGDVRTREKLEGSRVFDLGFVGDMEEPEVISVPPLTLREKHWLDQNLKTEKELEFELKPELLASFRKYYRHYPTYYETLV